MRVTSSRSDFGTSFGNGGGGVEMCADITSAAVSATKGGRPVSSS